MADYLATPKRSGIRLNPKHKGMFTRWAKSHGFTSIQAAATHVLAHRDKYPKHVVQMANFARNQRKFNRSGSNPKPSMEA